MIDYFFSGNKYIRVSRGDTGPGSINPGYPAPISVWEWGAFGANGIDAALYSGSKCYFFSGNQYIRVSRGVDGPGTVDPGYPAPISNWGWGAFGANGIDAALWSGSKCYFFKGAEYIRVTRGDTGPGVVDPGYPAPISVWNWGSFGADGIDGALYSGSKCYFFKGDKYIRVSRSDQGPGLLDPGYPAPISVWSWGAFGARGIKAPLYSGGPLVPPPPMTGLVSNSNYFMESNGNSLLGLSATVNVDVDVISSANAWSMQLNGYSASGDSTGVQQYVVYVSPDSTQLFARIDNWTTDLTELIRADVALASLPTTTLPAGYAISITLNNDSSGNVTGATYVVTDNTGRTLGNKTINIVGQNLRTTNTPATSANLAPLRAFQFNIGGDYGGARATLTSGAGTITYSASTPLSTVNTPPSYIDDRTAVTVESANLGFGPLPASANNAVTQSFQATAEAAAVAFANMHALEQATGRRGLVLPPPSLLRAP
jgi:hypothetical protein